MPLPFVSSEVKLEMVVEELETVYRNTQDFLGLRHLGNLYELTAERHRESDVSRWVVIEWFERAADMYRSALSAFRAQSEDQPAGQPVAHVPGFEAYLAQRISHVEMLIELLKPYGLRPEAAKATEPVAAGIG